MKTELRKNACGTALTKYASATHRAAVNCVRPFFVWLICLILDWEKFSWLQLIGYIIAAYGMMIYYNLLPMKIWTLCVKKEEITNDLQAKMIKS